MATYEAFWDFDARDLTASELSGDSLASASAAVTTSGSLRYYNNYWEGVGGYWLSLAPSQSTLAARLAVNYLTFTITPTSAVDPWMPGSLVFDFSSISSSGSTWSLRTTSGTVIDGATLTRKSPAFSTFSIDLGAHFGQVTGPLSFRLHMAGGGSYSAIGLNDVHITGEFGAQTTTINPAGITSREVFGIPRATRSSTISLVGIMSGEVFGQVSAARLLTVNPAGITSGLAFGQVSPARFIPVNPAGITSGEVFGQVSYSIISSLLLVGITSGEVFGDPSIRVNLPTPDEIATLANIPNSPNVKTTIDLIATFARSYTRGNGFIDDEKVEKDIGKVITTAAIRLLANPEQLDIRVGNVSRSSYWQGWTLAEQIILNQYRKVAY